MKEFLILKSEYYGHNDKLIKTMSFDSYKKHGKVWISHMVKVHNLKSNRGTTLETKSYSTKKLGDGDFSMAALEEG